MPSPFVRALVEVLRTSDRYRLSAIVEMADRLLPLYDKALTDPVAKWLEMHGVELHLGARAVGEGGGAVGQRRSMDEDVLAVVRGKEAKALVHVVPPHLAGRHGCPFSPSAPE